MQYFFIAGIFLLTINNGVLSESPTTRPKAKLESSRIHSHFLIAKSSLELDPFNVTTLTGKTTV